MSITIQRYILIEVHIYAAVNMKRYTLIEVQPYSYKYTEVHICADIIYRVRLYLKYTREPISI